jgi:hypothetical protein
MMRGFFYSCIRDDKLNGPRSSAAWCIVVGPCWISNYSNWPTWLQYSTGISAFKLSHRRLEAILSRTGVSSKLTNDHHESPNLHSNNLVVNPGSHGAQPFHFPQAPMPPLTRQDTVLSWWSDSNPLLRGPTINLHAVAKPLMRWMYHRQALELLKRNQGSPLLTETLEIYSSYFP